MLHQGKQPGVQKFPLDVPNIRSQKQISQSVLVCNCSENMEKLQKIPALCYGFIKIVIASTKIVN